jgi:hypothetical protein
VPARTRNTTPTRYHSEKIRDRSRIVRQNIKSRAKRKGLPYDLDDHAEELQVRIARGVCELSGYPLDLRGSKTFNSMSVDRIVPRKGYTYANIRIICLALNSALGNWGDKCVPAFRAWLARVDKPRTPRKPR